ncbi:MAG: hypothetical protein ABIH39_07910 [Candidatus Margulisiibacteriota bacterium]
MKRGFSLLEIVMALGFLAILLVPITQMLVAPDQESFYSQDHINAMQEVTALIEEIGQKNFEDPNSLPDVPSSSFGIRDDADEVTDDHTTWDDIDDYHSLVVTTDQVIASVSVVYWPDVTGNTYRAVGPVNDPTDFKLVSVNASYGVGQSVELTRVFINFYNP